MANNKQHYIVGISGGVDSAVSAHLLKSAGHQVTGIYMQNWVADQNDPYCSAAQDLSDAQAVCDRIGIPLETVNFAKEYWNSVFQFCLDEFAAGRTPNPDIGCNREIKFNVFLEYALTKGADKLATGHYAQIIKKQAGFFLYSAKDSTKDQAYFLHALNQDQLKHAAFPLGELTKIQVREIAKSAGLINHNKKDSTGICFIGERKFKNFLKEYILAQPGDIENEEGKKIGRHDGIMFYTLGQRKGLNIGGVANYPELPWYLIEKNISKNILVVSQNPNHPSLIHHEIEAENPTWISGKAPELNRVYYAKIRHLQDNQRCEILLVDSNTLRLRFERPQRAVTPGQYVVLYNLDDDLNFCCLGGACIK
jgi:tRNA-specific 2-thiouridylase